MPRHREQPGMSETLDQPHRHPEPSGDVPVRATLPEAPMGLLESYCAARRNLLEIIPRRALHQPVLSGRTGPQRWHMLMDPPAIRRVMLEAVRGLSEIRRDARRAGTGHRRQPVPRRRRPLALAASRTAPAFSARSIDALTPVMTRAAKEAAGGSAGGLGRSRSPNMVRAHDRRPPFDVNFRRRDLSPRTPAWTARGVVRALEAYVDEAVAV